MSDDTDKPLGQVCYEAFTRYLVSANPAFAHNMPPWQVGLRPEYWDAWQAAAFHTATEARKRARPGE